MSDNKSGQGDSGKSDGETSIEDANGKFIFYSKVKGPTMKRNLESPCLQNCQSLLFLSWDF